MNPYIQVLLADVFLAGVSVLQKKYQKLAGTSLRAGLLYNTMMGIVGILAYLFINQFEIHVTGVSIVLATAYNITCLMYIFAGFKIMERGNMAHYTLFLMSGGMTIPYVWGVIFLDEPLTWMRTLGLILIVAAIIFSNSGGKRPDKKTMLLCIATFFLNGVVSVLSKTHQIHPVSAIVSSADFAFWVMVSKAVCCLAILLILAQKRKTEDAEVVPEKFPIKAMILVVIFAGVMDALTFMLQLNGATQLPASVLYPLITGGSIILSTLGGVLVYREKLSGRQWAGIIICFAGTLLFL